MSASPNASGRYSPAQTDDIRPRAPLAMGGIARARWRRPFVGGLLVALVVMATAVASTSVIAMMVRRVLLADLRTYLQRSAETTAAMIDGKNVAHMTDSSQVGSDEYRELSAPLVTLLRTNPDIRFAYVGTIRGDTMRFVLDGDTTTERAYVGQQDVPTQGELDLEREQRTIVEKAPSPTAWGTGIRAYALVRTTSGSPTTYVGITMDARNFSAWMRRVYEASAVGLGVALLLAALGGFRVAATEAARLEADREVERAREREALAAEERRGLELRLERRQRIEALGTLAGGVAHDFNNLLSIILGNAELILSDEPTDSHVAESALSIRTAATRARDVARQILVFATPAAERRTVVSLVQSIEETTQLLSSTFPNTIALEWSPPDVEISTVADPSQIVQILMNLGVNASQALPDRIGTVAFGLSLVDVRPNEAQRLALTPGSYARFLVRDNGAGMTDDVRRRIFEPFFTTKAVGEGSGLGLSVVDGIVRAHAGAVDVVSSLGIGTTMYVYLPAVDPVTSDEEELVDVAL